MDTNLHSSSAYGNIDIVKKSIYTYVLLWAEKEKYQERQKKPALVLI